jgi:hypothetical protein
LTPDSRRNRRDMDAPEQAAEKDIQMEYSSD